MRRDSSPRRLTALGWPIAAILAVGAVAGAEPAPVRGRYEIGGGVYYLMPGGPLDASVGASLRYTRTLPWSLAKRAPGKPHPWALQFGIGTATVDRSAVGDQPAGTIRLTRLSAGAVRTLGAPGPRWSFSLGGHLDYYFPVAGDTTVADAPIGIASRLDASSGAGARVRLEAARRIGVRWSWYAGVVAVLASLDGSQRFVIDGVTGRANDFNLDLTGPELDLGLSRRF